MWSIYRHEMKANLKSLFIWAFCVGGMGFACILLFSGMQESMEGMAENFAAMGGFSDAFGMSQISIATLMGFYATEVGTIHSLGGAMFAAILGTAMLSKEEDGHTSEFLFSLPVSRNRVIAAKGCTIITNVILMNAICILFYMIGILIVGESIPTEKYALYHLMQLGMQLEIASVCYAVSAFTKKNKFGIGLGIVLFLYAYDLIARVIPDLSDYKVISPFSYANAADIFSTGEVCQAAAGIGAVVLIFSIVTAFAVYTKRDLLA